MTEPVASPPLAAALDEAAGLPLGSFQCGTHTLTLTQLGTQQALDMYRTGFYLPGRGIDYTKTPALLLALFGEEWQAVLDDESVLALELLATSTEVVSHLLSGSSGNSSAS